MTYPPRHVVRFAAALLSGCASFSPDGGMDAVQGIPPPQWARTRPLRTPEEARRRGRSSWRCCTGRSTPTAPCRSRCSTTATAGGL